MPVFIPNSQDFKYRNLKIRLKKIYKKLKY